MEYGHTGKRECTAGIGDLKRMVWQRAREPIEKKSRWTKARPLLLASMAALVVSVFLTWACLDAILIRDVPVPVRH